jgi:CRP-like cAMP-binding protein
MTEHRETSAIDNFFNYCKSISFVSVESRIALEQVIRVLSIKKNRELQPIGHTCRTIYFINKGIARIFYYKNETDITESFSMENDIIVRVESLFKGIPSQKGIQILEDSEIIAIDAIKLFRLYDQFHDLERLFRLIFEESHVDLVQRLESLQFHTAEERYKLLLKKSPAILQRVPLKYIASYLGITQVSLSRIRAQKG